MEGKGESIVLLVAALRHTSMHTPTAVQHLSYDGCLEVRVEIIRTVLCCIVY